MLELLIRGFLYGDVINLIFMQIEKLWKYELTIPVFIFLYALNSNLSLLMRRCVTSIIYPSSGIIKVMAQFPDGSPIEPKGVNSKWCNDCGVLTSEKWKLYGNCSRHIMPSLLNMKNVAKGLHSYHREGPSKV
jgi:hypothetical protein